MAYIKNPEHAVSYSKFRPSPPKELIEKIVSFLKEMINTPLGSALDIGCGSGQSTEILAAYFQQVIGVDNSEEQLQQARSNNIEQNVTYRLGSAEKIEEEDSSVDLVSVGMAVHWFDLSKFSCEVGRVLRPNGVLALYGYGVPLFSVDHISLADTMFSMFEGTLGQYMPEESRLIYFDTYKGQQFSKFSFSSQHAQRFEFLLRKENANIEDLLGYISTTSSFQKYMILHGESDAHSLLSKFRTELLNQLGADEKMDEVSFDITFPYVLLLIRKDM